MKWDEVKELAPLYAIGALDAETAGAVEASLRNASPEEQREIAEWREIVALLPHALAQPAPPDHLKERLLSRLAEDTGGEMIDPNRLDEGLRRLYAPSPGKARLGQDTWWPLAAAALLLFLADLVFRHWSGAERRVAQSGVLST